MIRDVFYYGKKPNVHPREKFAESIEHAKSLATTEHFWIINEFCDYRNFDWDYDFDFLPDNEVWTKDHINIWPSQHQKDSGTWLCANNDSEIKIYLNAAPIQRKNENLVGWTVNYKIDTTKFDFSWHPDPTSPPYIYVWGNKWVPGEIHSTVEYKVADATNKKYMGNVELEPDHEKFKILLPIDNSQFDFTWKPNPSEPPYIYVWGNQHNKAEIEPTIEYHCDNATDRKYMSDIVAYVRPEYKKYRVLLPIDESKFDFTWRPNPHDPPYIYVWGNQHNKAEIEPTIEYHCDNATDRKYMSDIVACVTPQRNKFNILIPIDETKFDFSWRPNPLDQPFIYIWGNQWNDPVIEPTIEYHVPNATSKKYMTDVVAFTKSEVDKWHVPNNIVDFDFSWRPNPTEPPFMYQFPTQWQKTGGPKYSVDGSTIIKYMSYPVSIVNEDFTNWEIPDNLDKKNFDFSWHPDGLAPPYIYKFGTVLDDINLEDGPIYHTPNNDGHIVHLDINTIVKQKIDYPKYLIKTTLDDLIKEHENETFWAMRNSINYDNFDFDWKPNKENVFHINVFGSAESELTQTYLVNGSMIKKGYKEFNFVEDKKIDDEYLTQLFKPIDVFFIDKSNPESKERYEQLKVKFPNIKKTRYLNSWVDTINRCLPKCETELCWILNSELDYTDFDFNFYPNPWQMQMVHVFGTQWSQWGTTFIVNKESFPTDTKYIKVIEHVSAINFVKKTKAKATKCLHDIFFIDYENKESESIFENLKNRGYNLQKIKYNTSYLQTFKDLLNILPILKDHYIWVCSSICDYSNFDFTYICDPFSLEQLHVFPSDRQKYGDTFFVNVNKLRTLITDLDKLESLEKINFNQTFRPKRLKCPSFTVNEDTHTEFYKYEHDWPYAVYVVHDNDHIDLRDDEPISLWSDSSKNIVKTSTGATRVIIPKEAKSYIKKELYDYPYVISSNRTKQSKPLDIIFLSNGESCADENFEYLKRITQGIPNKIKRIDGVNGRVNAYHAAANASDTPWMFTVFAKLRVNAKFDWSWQPDRLQVPKHYIFNATNPVNGLEYGHQAMIAYNKKIVLANTGIGLDFTLDDEHEVVELNSGVATFNTDAFSTWRTAFREAIKLRNDISKESRNRLEIWLNVADGDYAEYSIKGAKDAVKYYEEVQGDLEKLKLSYEWAWLENYFKLNT